ncbi:MAG: molybdopterin cofactor-binding domain-containing protein [Bacteroidales bacterium]
MKKNKYLGENINDDPITRDLDRRDFLKRMGGGLLITFSMSDYPLLFGGKFLEDEKPGMNAYLRIAEDERISLYTGKIEMGQGPITSLGQMLADELDVHYDSIDIFMGDTDLCPWDGGTYGSLSTRVFGPLLRAAGAEARATLLEMAAENLSVPVDGLEVRDGIVTAKGDKKKKVSYGTLTSGKEIIKKLKKKPVLKNPSEFRYMGQSMLRIDAEEKVTGEARYSGDIQLPGMRCARILRGPSHFSKLISVDTSAAESMDGIEVVRDGDLVAVLHELPDMADIAISKVNAEYETKDPDVNDQSIFEHLVKSGNNKRILDEGGDLEVGLQQSSQVFEMEYLDGYVAHAPIENHTATAMMEGDVMKIWASTQTPYPAKEEVAELLDMPEEKVHIMQIFVGGGFGGKIYNQQVLEVARLVKLTGKPIQLAWTRREEFQYDRLRPAAVVRIKSGINDSGQITLWDYDVFFAGGRGAKQYYEVPNHKTVTSSTGRGEPDAHMFYTGAWRAPAHNTNTFARESQIEIMAAAAGNDPLEFRLRQLKDAKYINVLKMAAEKFGWTPARGPSGRGYGIACGTDTGTTVGMMAEVEVDKTTGHVQVKRVVVAMDMGLVVNPQGAIIQAEGCINMGLGYALGEDIRFVGGKMLTRNFDTYDIARFSWTPEQIEVLLVDAQDEPPHGGGEPAIICMGGVLANAIFDATGARLNQMPMTPERVLEAIQSTS